MMPGRRSLNLISSSAPRPKELRNFGFIIGSIFLAYGIFPLFKGSEIRWISVGIAPLLFFPAWISPQILKWPYLGWMKLGNTLGQINTKLILSIFFYGILTPIAFLMKLCKRDVLALKWDPATPSYRIPLQRRDPRYFERMF